MPSLVALFPPLLLLYPPSYILMLLRTLFPLRARRTLVRSGGELRPAALVSDAKDASDAEPNDADAEDPAADELKDGPTPVPLQRLGAGALPFCEDVVMWRGTAIFSCDPSRDIYNPFAAEGDPAAAANGRLVAYSTGSGEVYDIAHDFAGELHPLGVGVHRSLPLLALANLSSTGAAVEMFALTESDGRVAARHLRSLAHPNLSTPNAVVPLSETSVLVTNSFRYAASYSKVLNTFETFLAIPGGSVLHLASSDGETTCETVARGIALANGLALSDDGSVLAVAGCVTANIHIYDVYPPLLPIQPANEELAARIRFRESIPAGFMVDNLRFVATDTAHVFLACGHPSGLDFTACAKSHGARLSGTRAVAVRVGLSLAGRGRRAGWWNAMFRRVDARVRTVFEDDGSVLGTGATACADGEGGIIVTGLFDRRGPVRCADVEV